MKGLARFQPKPQILGETEKTYLWLTLLASKKWERARSFNLNPKF
jgi:hypothetical protein